MSDATERVGTDAEICKHFGIAYDKGYAAGVKAEREAILALERAGLPLTLYDFIAAIRARSDAQEVKP